MNWKWKIEKINVYIYWWENYDALELYDNWVLPETVDRRWGYWTHFSMNWQHNQTQPSTLEHVLLFSKDAKHEELLETWLYLDFVPHLAGSLYNTNACKND